MSGRKRKNPLGPKLYKGARRVHPSLMRSRKIIVRMSEDEWQRVNEMASMYDKSLSLMARTLMVQSL